MQPINLAWISPSKLSEKMGALEKVDATKIHSRTKAISSECRSNGHRWNAAIFTGIGSCPAAPWPGHTFWHNRQLNVHVDQALRRTDSVTSTDIREGLGKGDDIGIPFGNTRARWNKRSVLHFNANEKVPRRTKSPRSFISREKPEVELCRWTLSPRVGRRGAAAKEASQGWRRNRCTCASVSTLARMDGGCGG